MGPKLTEPDAGPHVFDPEYSSRNGGRAPRAARINAYEKL